MTSAQARALVAEIDATWNYPFKADPARVAAWVKAVVLFDHRDALKAFEACKASYRERPSPAEFGQTCRASERQRHDHETAAQLHQSRTAALPPAPYSADADAERARLHIAGQGQPATRPATVAYSREWRRHLRDPMARIGRTDEETA